MKYRLLGNSGLRVSAIGFGCMSIGIADVYSSSLQSEDDAIALVHRALDLGINFLDTANTYGDSEIKVGKALRGRRDEVVLATKFGRPGSSGQNRAVDGSPENARRSCDSSLQRLGVDVIDLFYLHRVDPRVLIEDTVGAMADLVQAGKVRYIGLSEASPATVRRADKVHPITAVQTEYSLFTRDAEDELLPTLRELGTSLVAYSPLGRGFLGARFRSIGELAPNDWRRGNPRFQGEQFQRNLVIADIISGVAREKGVTPAQLALAWVLARGEDIVPIPGTSSAQRLEENARSLDLVLTTDDVDSLERAAPKGAVVGDRYESATMQLLNG
jgi:aryl-alcohol dehydrogenase-like predicted oxidoreductase